MAVGTLPPKRHGPLVKSIRVGIVTYLFVFSLSQIGQTWRINCGYHWQQPTLSKGPGKFISTLPPRMILGQAEQVIGRQAMGQIDPSSQGSACSLFSIQTPPPQPPPTPSQPTYIHTYFSYVFGPHALGWTRAILTATAVAFSCLGGNYLKCVSTWPRGRHRGPPGAGGERF